MLLIACQSTDQADDHDLEVALDFTQYSVARYLKASEIVINEQDMVKELASVLAGAVQEPGAVNMAEPEYEISLHYDSKESEQLFLWINNGYNSTLMRSSNTETIYSVSAEQTEQLKTLVADQLEQTVHYSQVSISRIGSGGTVTYTDEQIVTELEQIFADAVQQPGITDMVSPNYEVKFDNEAGASSAYFLWTGEAGEERAMMVKSDTHTLYLIDPSKSDRLMELIDEQF
ncbi:hypothetical protein SAMN04488134_10376 [Amphibacillus marinus]|uniref:YhfM-like domain-containing protein n=2 Tax=Amphibacillus marinus TaxID=872970 RepID=A0A1H8L469_9BACI|nr:hypothetical protein SAMN04488134_10376 [Amphibacillus marinus]